MWMPSSILVLFLFISPYSLSWNIHRCYKRLHGLHSTPFEAGFYDNPYQNEIKPSTSVPADTKLVLGLNKYSHDTTLCAADAKTGKVLFALSKERLTRRKHDAGNVALLVESCLDALDLQLDAIIKVVSNNHHHRVLPIETDILHMEWESGLRINDGVEDGYYDDENLLPDADHFELSHHLAHAYSAATQAPFEQGLVVIMDGMGETYRTMLRGVLDNDKKYTSDFSFGLDSFQCIPHDLHEVAKTSYFDWREAESVYTFTKEEDSIDIKPIFKRFTAENSPPTLYNHGFENMDSVGALYSRVSSHIFGDWNACGKVMGLAPWANHTWVDDKGEERRPEIHESTILEGRLFDESVKIERSLITGTPLIARNDPELFREDGTRKKRYDFDDYEEVENEQKLVPAKVALEAIALAHRVQSDLETTCIDFVRHFKETAGARNLCLAGGVALNSVLNGRLARELGFDHTFIPPYPGDDGIAVGCCAFGLFGNKELDASRGESVSFRPRLWQGPLSPYLGPDPTGYEMKLAIEVAKPWLEVEIVRKVDQRLLLMTQEIASGGVVAWYHSRSELGPRALGHRSILADPRKKGLVRFINEHVKSRECFRPFAPSVLAEEAAKWFDLGKQLVDTNVSPYMSMTAMVHPNRRSKIPAVTHVDGSSRLQTVAKEDEPLYHKLLSKFFKETGVPLVLNTSFNTLPGEPIVESPSDAVKSFLCSMGSIEMLVMGDYVIKRKQPDLRKLLGEMTKTGDIKIEPVCPKRSGRAEFQSSFEFEVGETDADSIETKTRVRMPARPMHDKRNEWFELLDEFEGELLSISDGTVTMNDIMAQFTMAPEDKPIGKDAIEEAQTLLQNIVHRLVRLYEHTLISW